MTKHLFDERPIPLRPDAAALRERNVRAITRACIATARGKASQKGLAASEIVRRTWPNDETARLITRAARDADYPALGSWSRRAALRAVSPALATARLG